MTKFGKIILIILIIIFVFIIVYFLQKKPVAEAPIIEDKKEEINLEILGNKDDLISFSIVPGAKMPNGILSYRGSIKGGYFFEGNILINILDANKNLLKASNAMAIGEWMTEGPVEFEGNIDFTDLPKGEAYFEIKNDNASGLPENDKSILIPILIE